MAEQSAVGRVVAVLPAPGPRAAPGESDATAVALRLGDTVVRALFDVGLQLQAVLPRVDPSSRARLQAAVDDLEATIGGVRDVVLALLADPDRGR